jgi:RNA polymerase sigma-70 factor (ECF subfamily)
MTANESPPDAGPLEEVLAHRHACVQFVRSRVGSEAVAEEIVQNAFLRQLESAQDIRDDERVVAWFYRVLRNAIVDHRRRTDAEQRALAREAAEPAPTADLPPDEQARACACVRAVARALRPEYATLVEQVDVDERPLSEVAAELGITANNAAVRLHRARAALRERVRMTCRTCAEHGCVDCT